MKKYFLILALIAGLSLHADHDTAHSMVGQFVWNELATTNVQGAKDFYGKMFGWEFIDHKVGDMTYTIVKKGNREFAGIWSVPAGQQNQVPPHWLSYIMVENIEQSLNLARQNGAIVLKSTEKAGDMGLFAIIRDPVGAHIALWQSLQR